MPPASFQVASGALGIEAPDELRRLVEDSWLPRNARSAAVVSNSLASIRLRMGDPPRQSPSHRPTLRLGGVSLWMLPQVDSGVLAGTAGCSGTLDLTGLRADLIAPATPSAAPDVYSMLTISAALLLGRSGQALVHAAAVVSPDGETWLLVGDARSGKSTTIANLISRGWNYLSDDQVVLRQWEGGIEVQGLPRPFHLDEGWGTAAPRQVRRSVDPATLGPGHLVDSGSLGGVLFPQVVADRPTALEAISPADAMAALVRQSPWLLADPTSATPLMNLLRVACAGRRYRLSLGLDTFQDGALLEERLHRGPGTPALADARRAEIAMGQATASATA